MWNTCFASYVRYVTILNFLDEHRKKLWRLSRSYPWRCTYNSRPLKSTPYRHAHIFIAVMQTCIHNNRRFDYATWWCGSHWCHDIRSWIWIRGGNCVRKSSLPYYIRVVRYFIIKFNLSFAIVSIWLAYFLSCGPRCKMAKRIVIPWITMVSTEFVKYEDAIFLIWIQHTKILRVSYWKLL